MVAKTPNPIFQTLEALLDRQRLQISETISTHCVNCYTTVRVTQGFRHVKISGNVCLLYPLFVLFDVTDLIFATVHGVSPGTKKKMADLV